jgi:hypothetical protein
MEREKLEYDIVMDAGLHAEVLCRVRDLDFGAAVYMAAVAKYPNRNIQLRQDERIIKRHDGEPKPEPETTDPNLKSWSVHLIGGRKMQTWGSCWPLTRSRRDRGGREVRADRRAAQAAGCQPAAISVIAAWPFEIA